MGLGRGAFLGYTAAQIGFGILAGLVMGYLGARYIRWGRESGWMSSKFQKLGWLALVLLSYGMAELIGGNGFIAAFVFGITSGNTLRHDEGESLYAYAEVENSLMILLTFVIFGMVMLAPALKHIDLTVVLYALLSLTAVRMIPVAISLLDARLKPVTVLFLGWFGPRGIASILYVLTVLEDAGRGSAHREADHRYRSHYHGLFQHNGPWHQRCAPVELVRKANGPNRAPNMVTREASASGSRSRAGVLASVLTIVLGPP
jgi:NhaP-type Na+/H+ or K+/H+ antiporter